MKKYVVLILAVLLLFLASELALAQGYMTGRGKASDMMKQGMSMRIERGMQGLGFMHSAGNAYGEYVTFTVDGQGNVLNYGVAGETLFNISIANFNYSSTTERGSITLVSNNDGSTTVKLHDNPAAVINILTSKAITVTFTLAEGATASKEDNFVKIESGNVTGYILGGNITSTISGSQVRIDTTPNSAVVFRASPVNMPALGLQKIFSQEIARNKVGMEIAIGRNRSYNAINYSERMQLRIQAMERDRIKLVINSTDPAGKIVAINLDNSTLEIMPRYRLRINYDGMPLQCVNNPDAVFNGTTQPLCWISQVQDRTRAQLMIYIPNFSERTIDIVVEPEVETPSPTANATTAMPTATPAAPGFEVVASLAGLLILALVRRRNKA